jgi:microcystin-dependent protein
VSLSAMQMPAHTHPVLAAGAAATSTSPSGAFWAAWRSPQYRTSAPTAAMNPGTVGPAGGSQPHENMPPFLATNFIIALSGLYPTQT